MAEFWNSLSTEKSWDVLVQFSKEPIKFIVIGGWATYLWTKLHKSKDIDIAIADIKNMDYLKYKYNLKKNDSLKKYEIQFDEIDLDIYVPYFSKLALPVEDLGKYTGKIEGFTALKPEALLILKQGAEIERRESVKGAKDQIDIMGLLVYTDFNAKFYFEILKKYKLENYFQSLKKIISNFKDYEYLNLDPREFKKRKIEVVEKLKINFEWK